MGQVEQVNTKNLTAVTGSRVVKPEVVSERETNAALLRDRIIALRDAVASSYFELGKHLYTVQKEGLYLMWGFDDFSEYVEVDVGLVWRKALHLMRIHRYFTVELGNRSVYDRVQGLGWAKATALVEVVNTSNVDAWVEKATTLPVRKLEDEVRLAKRVNEEKKKELGLAHITHGDTVGNDSDDDHERSEKATDAESRRGNAVYTKAKGDRGPKRGAVVHGTADDLGVDPVPGGESRRRHDLTMRVSDDQKENIELAMKLAHDMLDDGEPRFKKEKNRDAKGHLMDYICTSFIAGYNGSVRESKIKHRANFKAELFDSIERSFGVKIVAFNSKTEEIVYGHDTVDGFINEEEAEEDQ